MRQWAMCGLGVPPKFTLESAYPTWRVIRQGLWEVIMSWGWVSELGGQAPIKVVPQDSLPSRWGHSEKLLAMNREEAPHSTKLTSWSWMFQTPREINVCFYKLPVCMLSYSGVSDSLWPRGLMPARLLCPWDSPGKLTCLRSHRRRWSCLGTLAPSLMSSHLARRLFRATLFSPLKGNDICKMPGT